MTEIEVFVIVDSEGQYVSHVELSDCQELADENGMEPCRRVIRVTLNVPTPTFIEVEATLPEETNAATVTVK